MMNQTYRARYTLRETKRIKVLACACVVIIVLFFVGCANNANYDNSEEMDQTQIQAPKQENQDEDQEIEEIQVDFSESDVELEAVTESEAEVEIIADDYGPVAVSQLDYDSFQSRMTDEEWAGFEQYFPVLKENIAFECTNFGSYTRLNKDGEVIEAGKNVKYYRYDSQGMTDLDHYVKTYVEDGLEEMMILEVRVLDLDGDGTEELILEWTPVGDFLILHCENEKFYGWEIMYRGFERLQTNGVYVSSGGAGSNCWYRLQFDNGSWLEEKLAEEDWGEYYINGEAVDEDTFLQQIDTYETDDVSGYAPKRRVS